MTIAERNYKLHHKLHRRIIFFSFIFAISVFVLEFALLITRSIFPALGQISTSDNLKVKILLPSLINFAVLIVGFFILNSQKYNLRVKNWAACSMVFTICCVVAVVYREFNITVFLPCVAILFSTVFADKILVLVVSILGGLVFETGVILTLLSKETTIPFFVISVIVSVMLLLFCILVAVIMMRTASNRVDLIRDAYSDQEELIDELHVEPMTGLSNRTALEEAMTAYIQKFHEGVFVPHLVLMDIDHFKDVNDTFGHNAGDAVIKNLASIIKTNMNGSRCAFRFGGDEMVLIFGKESLDDIKPIIENIRNQFRATRYTLCPGRQFTISVGVAPFYKGLNQKSWFELTDSIMYKSKEGGRDTVTFADEH